jgi:hypothetical protein
MDRNRPIAVIRPGGHVAYMAISNPLLTIEGSFAIGAVIGALIGVALEKQKVGCLALWAVPVAMVLYVGWWQGQHPEAIRSTSGLDFVFGPLWPSLGALCGFYGARLLRSLFLRH